MTSHIDAAVRTHVDRIGDLYALRNEALHKVLQIREDELRAFLGYDAEERGEDKLDELVQTYMQGRAVTRVRGEFLEEAEDKLDEERKGREVMSEAELQAAHDGLDARTRAAVAERMAEYGASGDYPSMRAAYYQALEDVTLSTAKHDSIAGHGPARRPNFR